MEMDARLLHTWVLALSGLITVAAAVGVCVAQPPTPGEIPSAVRTHEAPGAKPTGDRPLPQLDELIRQVETQQGASRKTLQEYTYRSFDSDQELDSHGAVKKSTTKETERICANNICISKLVAVDGKPLSDDAVKRQDEALGRETAWIKDRREKMAAGLPPPPPPKIKDSDGVGDSNLNYANFVSAFLQVGPRLGTFSNLRRVDWKGRETIAIDYLGNPDAKSPSLLEGVFRNLAGTVWVDEQDHALVRMEGRVYQDYKIGGGLLADVHKGATVQMDWIKVNDEVWLPATFSGRGSARLLIFSSHSDQIDQRWSDYRKFRTTTTILPAVAAVPEAAKDPEPAPIQP